jgi:hypothetical protein
LLVQINIEKEEDENKELSDTVKLNLITTDEEVDAEVRWTSVIY